MNPVLPDIRYLHWAKTQPPVDINMARSGVEPCPPSRLKLSAADIVVWLPVQYGYVPLREAIAARYGVSVEQVFTVSGGTSLANWLACATLLDDARAEVIVERPTYEPLLAIPRALGARIVRLPRRFDDRYAIDLERFESLITRRTKLAVVSNLHNPSCVRIDEATLRAMAARLAHVGAMLLVDEVYLECVFDDRAASCVHAGPNVITTSSLTKAYGLDGLRCGWILGPPRVMTKVMRAHNALGNNAVAMGERMSLAAFARLDEIGREPRATMKRNLRTVRRWLSGESRISGVLPDGGNVAFLRLPRGMDDVRFAAHLRERYSTSVAPGKYFESRGHLRIGFGLRPDLLERGLAHVSRALDDLA